MQNKEIKKVNFVFWGTPEVASETLEILKENGYLPSLIITSPDAKKGRGLRMQSSPVAVFTEHNNIPCMPRSVDLNVTGGQQLNSQWVPVQSQSPSRFTPAGNAQE